MKLLSRKFHYLWIAFAIYAITTAVLSLRHTMWRDELQIWLIGYKSSSFNDLMHNRRAEIHPMGYHTFTWVVSRFTSNPEILKLTNWMLSLIMALLVLFKTKLDSQYKILFIFGLIPLIGYSNIAEQYMPATLFFVLLLNLYTNGRNQIWFFLVAGILANIHMSFLLATSGFVLIYTYESFKISGNLSHLWRLNKKIIALTTIYAASVLLAVNQISRSTASGMIADDMSATHFLKRSVVVLASACFPFQVFDSSTNGIQITSLLFAILGLSILVGLFYSALKLNVRLCAAILISNILLIVGMVIGYSSYWWHFGVLFLTIFGSFVILFSMSPVKRISLPFAHVCIGIVLVSQIVALFIGPRTNLWETKPYSTAEQAATYLKSQCNENCTIIMNSQSSGASISGYLAGREIFYVDINDFGTFAAWNKPSTDVDWNLMISSARKFQNSVLVTTDLTNPPQEVKLMKSFSEAIWTDENFTIWKFAP